MEGFFKYFEALSAVPRVSHHTSKATQFCIDFALEHGLEYYSDDMGNVIIYKPATPGYESHPAVIMQGHIDMVGAKTDSSSHDFLNDGIKLIINEAENYITADGTTLGADNGIAVAYIMEILASDSYRHPAIEAVFTVDEEVGLLGANALDCSKLSGRYLINLDSEDDAAFIVGCAGGLRSDLVLNNPVIIKKGIGYKIIIDGLLGGHSGDMIGTGRPSANVLLGRILKAISDELEYDLVSLYGGEVDNAIAPSAEAVIVYDGDMSDIVNICNLCNSLFLQEYEGIDDNISIRVENLGENQYECVSQSGAAKIVFLLTMLPYGVIARNPFDINLVNTSLNPGVLRLSQGAFKLGYSIRSSIAAAKRQLADRISYAVEFMGGECEESGDYPSWPYKPVSKLRDIVDKVYMEQYGKGTNYVTIHAGLECGIFADKIEGIDIISYGPNMKDIHTPNETLYIDSAVKVFDFTVKLLENL